MEIEEGVTLLEAAERAGIYLNSLCGGEGVCGKCRVRIASGNAKPDKHSIAFFHQGGDPTGLRPGCQTEVGDDLEVFVPPESRLEELAEALSIVYSRPEWISLHKRPYGPASLIDPLVKEVYLELPEPTIDDNIPDTGHPTRELGKKIGCDQFEIPLSCLRGLSTKLRQYEWKVTVSRYDTRGKVLFIEGGDTANNNYGLGVDVGTTTWTGSPDT